MECPCLSPGFVPCLKELLVIYVFMFFVLNVGNIAIYGLVLHKHDKVVIINPLVGWWDETCLPRGPIISS